ncbi:hypothetical protein Dsin_011652 [Dipteronia sinensis]|uniref:Reverse transcriptase domain-containing protein n=1 Tax=Dipteronia sinensis TaxID=43782 RepID=A0AAE0AGN2_9ROSI|nr:hypothetical protein Dsin_011652 [Dipteronia sinensis]
MGLASMVAQTSPIDRFRGNCSRGLGGEIFGSFGKLINFKREVLERLVSRAGEEGISKKIREVESELECLFSKEEVYWKQRSRVEWLAAGDRNSKFFHWKVSARKKRYWIEKLEDDRGRQVTYEEGITKTVCKLNNSERVVLGSNFSTKDVKGAPFSIGSTKSQWPDGFHALFFQKLWEVDVSDVSRVCLRILNGECSIKDFNKTNVVLIPKKKNPVNLKDFKPGKIGFAALKLDMSKAYDRVEWGFLRSVIVKMGFSLRWMELVHDCISLSTLGFVINGKVLGEVVPSGGLRQRCPLSPYLFLMCAESLSCLIKNSEKDGKLLGFRCCRTSPLVSHLFFSDHKLLFYKATVGSCEEISRVLKVYESGLGQMVNLQKPNITFSPNVSQGLRGNIQAVLRVNNAQTNDKLLKAKYFRKDEFLRASLKLEASYVWRSIIWGRELLVKRIRWKVCDGTYEVRSGYILAMKEMILEACSDPSIDQRWWTRMWNLNIPPKVKKFIWRFCNNVIPYHSNLSVRKVVNDVLCQRCNKEAESMAHAVWWCDKADLVWAKTVFWGRLRRFKGLGYYEILRSMAECLKNEDFEALCMVIWGVWVDRNDDCTL